MLARQAVRAVAVKAVACSFAPRPVVATPSLHQARSYSNMTSRLSNPGLAALVDAYRRHGHLRANLDPLGMSPKRETPQIDTALYGLNDPEEVFAVEGIVSMPNGVSHASLQDIINHLEDVYCNTVGMDFDYIRSDEEREWLREQVESVDWQAGLSGADKRNIHSLMVQSETFDKFMSIKFPGFKRYGCEGAESTLPAMEAIFSAAAKHGVEKVVLGMPHRGRLNMLVSLFNYPARALFAKVKGQSHIPEGMDGKCDVASHIATTVTKKFDGKNEVTVSLLQNPSHLEAVNPVSQGKTRAKMDEAKDATGAKNMCLQLHGDTAFIGQGVVPESLMLSQLPDFKTGGTVHLVVNNQLGFTCGALKARSSLYSSDIGRVIDTPVLHVNAEDPERVIQVCRLAVDYRAKFGKDVIVDLIGYRKHGHNELDEPGFTQPNMYKNIRTRDSGVKNFEDKLVEQKLLTKESSEKLASRLMSHLDAELQAVPEYKPSQDEHFQGKWKGYWQTKSVTDLPDTGVAKEVLKQVALDSVKLPADFNAHPRLVRAHVEARTTAVNNGAGIDWATAESMAFGSLMKEGYNVRVSGQDVERGTFSQRHGVITDQVNENRYSPLANAGYPGSLQLVSSHLSEFAVLGFEFGYSWESPKNLAMWEAQFGDFHNGAQIIIDNFISSSEDKWLRATGMVMLLPHGFDGAGPEHSSARIERFLQLVNTEPNSKEQGNVNLLAANPTTPANYFHLLRRQMIRKYRKPLVVFSPKVLLRHSQAVSTLEDMAPGTHFQPVIDDNVDKTKVDTVVLVSGKSYFDLAQKRQENKSENVAFVRVEELSPFPFAEVEKVLEGYTKKSKGVKRVLWFQEEPSNAGAWSYVEPRLNLVLSEKQLPSVKLVSRPSIASVAVGAGVLHKAEVEKLFADLFNACK